jgi:hypothetical protein
MRDSFLSARPSGIGMACELSAINVLQNYPVVGPTLYCFFINPAHSTQAPQSTPQHYCTRLNSRTSSPVCCAAVEPHRARASRSHRCTPRQYGRVSPRCQPPLPAPLLDAWALPALAVSPVFTPTLVSLLLAPAPAPLACSCRLSSPCRLALVAFRPSL